jgi:hypothetical protein
MREQLEGQVAALAGQMRALDDENARLRVRARPRPRRARARAARALSAVSPAWCFLRDVGGACRRGHRPLRSRALVPARLANVVANQTGRRMLGSSCQSYRG